MEIAVISDLHLGPGGPADGFGHDDSEFLKFLDFLEGNFERVVLLGDIWETLTTHRLGDARGGLAEARAAHPEIAARFARSRYSYVHGNHDIVAGPAEAAPEELLIEADGQRLLFTHGHHHDLLIRRARWLSELGVWLGGWLRRLALSPVYRAFETLDHWRGGVEVDASKCTFQRWAGDLAREREVDVVVTGHTHVAATTEHPDHIFVNGGSCAGGRYSFAALDTKSGGFGIHTEW